MSFSVRNKHHIIHKSVKTKILSQKDLLTKAKEVSDRQSTPILIERPLWMFSPVEGVYQHCSRPTHEPGALSHAEGKEPIPVKWGERLRVGNPVR